LANQDNLPYPLLKTAARDQSKPSNAANGLAETKDRCKPIFTMVTLWGLKREPGEHPGLPPQL